MQLQHISSNTCGKYVAVFLIYKILKGGSLNIFKKIFNKNTYINDILINKLYNYYLRLK